MYWCLLTLGQGIFTFLLVLHSRRKYTQLQHSRRLNEISTLSIIHFYALPAPTQVRSRIFLIDYAFKQKKEKYPYGGGTSTTQRTRATTRP